MIHKTTAIAATSAFVMGFGISWLIQSSQSDQVSQAGSPPAAAREFAARSPSFIRTDRTPNSDDLLREMEELEFEARSALLDELDSADFPALLRAISSKSGFTGLSKADEALLRSTVAAWSAKDREAALQWALLLKGEVDRQNLLGAVLEGVFEVNVDEGLALLESLQKTYGEEPDISFDLLGKAAGQDAESFVALCRASGSSGPGRGMPISIPEDFEFATALNGLSELNASLREDGKMIPRFPTNLLKEWAKRDSQAALDWVLYENNDMAPFNGLREFTQGYGEVATDAEMGAVILDIQKFSGGYKDAWRMMKSEAVLHEFVTAASAIESRDQVIQDLLNESLINGEGGGGNASNMRSALLGMMDLRQRIEFLTGENAPKYKLGRSDWEALRTELERLRHTPEEVDQIMNR